MKNGNLNEAVTGKQLKSIFESEGYVEKLFPHFISDSHNTALERISGKYQVDRKFAHWEIPLFNAVNRYLLRPSYLSGYENSMHFVAPHTHWDQALPIIQKYDTEKDKYLIGNLTIIDDKIYRPTTFVWDGCALKPYEWIDSTVGEIGSEFPNTVIAMEKLARQFLCGECMFGLAIDFKFKNHLSDEHIGAIEKPVEEVGLRNKLSEIVKSNTITKGSGVTSEQVGWLLTDDLTNKMTDEEVEFLKIVKSENFDVKDFMAILN